MRERRSRDSAGGMAWGPFLPFAALLLAVLYVPWSSYQATVDMTVRRETENLSFLVDRVAAGLRIEGGHLSALVSQMAEALAAQDPAERRAGMEVKAAWQAVQSMHAVEGLLLYDAEGRPEVVRGLDDGDPSTGPALRAVADLALRNPDQVVGDVWTGRDRANGASSLNLALGAAVVGADGQPEGAVLVSMGVSRLLEGVVGNEAGTLDVSFTLLNRRGEMLLHSGFGLRNPDGGQRTCRGCHALVEDDAQVGKASATRRVIDGQERLVVRMRVPFGGEEWTLWASTPMRGILLPLAQQQIGALVFTGLVVVLLLAGGLLMRRSQIRRIRLEDRVRAQERMLDLAAEKDRLQEELEGARRMASIGLMVSRVAHEVKNPLQYIGTGVDLLGAAVKDESARELVADLKTGVRTLDAIVKELLDFGRPMTVHPMPTQLNDLAREVLDRVVPPDVEAVLESDPDLPEVEVDPYKIRQVLENLVRNAVEAVAGQPPEAPRAQVRIVTRREGNGARLLVRDNGPGIAAEAMASLWDPFYTTKTRGTGLGLAVVRRIVEAHGGTVKACSVPGEGACFEVHLPPVPGVS